jgi:hypothetical protein
MSRIDSLLGALKQVANEISINQHSPDTNWKKLEHALNIFSITSEKLEGRIKDLSQVQVKQLAEIRNIVSRDTRRELTKEVKRIRAEHFSKAQKQDAEINRRNTVEERATDQSDKLFPEVEHAASAVMNASLAKIETEFKTYKSKRDELQQVLDQLPDDLRSKLSTKLNKLSHDVNSHVEQFNDQIKSVKRTIRKAIQRAAKDVKSMTVNDMLLSLAPGATKAQLLSILGNEQFKALKMPEQEGGVGTVVVATLPQAKQTELVKVLLNQLGHLDESSKKSGIVQAFAEAIARDVEGLISGEKSVLSLAIVGQGNLIQMVHIDVHALLDNPQLMIEKLAFAMYEQEAYNKEMVINFSSPREAAAMAQLDGRNLRVLKETGSLQALVSLTRKNANNLLAIGAIVGESVSEQSMMAFQTNTLTNTQQKSLKPTQVLDLLTTLTIMFRAKDILNGVEANLNVSDSRHVSSGLSVANADIKSLLSSAEMPTANMMDLYDIKEESDEELEAESVHDDDSQVPNNDLKKHYKNFNDLLIELETLNRTLKKNDSPKYAKLEAAGIELHNKLKAAGDTFFKTPTKANFKIFQEMCSNHIKNAEPVFNEHRGNSFGRAFLNIAKKIMGCIALIFAAPTRLVSDKPTQLIKAAFFTPAETKSGKELGKLKEKLADHGKDMGKYFGEDQDVGPTSPGSA